MPRGTAHPGFRWLRLIASFIAVVGTVEAARRTLGAPRARGHLQRVGRKPATEAKVGEAGASEAGTAHPGDRSGAPRRGAVSEEQTMREVTVTPETDARAMHVLARAVTELGGGAEMVRRHEQTLLPALAEAAYVLVLTNEQHCDAEQVAHILGVSRGAVESVIGAPTGMALARLRDRSDPNAEFEWHSDPQWSDTPSETRMEPEILAGALAKFAYGIVQRESSGIEELRRARKEVPAAHPAPPPA